jgi:hypothetical protein
MSGLPQHVLDHFRNLGREYGRTLAEQDRKDRTFGSLPNAAGCVGPVRPVPGAARFPRLPGRPG